MALSLPALPFQRRQRRRRRPLGPPPSSLVSLSLRQEPRRAERTPILDPRWNRPGGIGALVLAPPAAEIVAQERVVRLGREWDTPRRILGVEEGRVVVVAAEVAASTLWQRKPWARDFPGMQVDRPQKVRWVMWAAGRDFQGKQVGQPQSHQWFQHFQLQVRQAEPQFRSVRRSQNRLPPSSPCLA